ncbi:chromosome segregation in meiosis protein 3 [Paraphoma chrysanthemicola]|uniref:Chromosome segregation in meiosis protein n=1 Tax=Paraphoma chrysanthemicola TaxID=798071 RepID=A0A8K0VZT1_9PLEO|nr:chromosome segregation in meiosis protein 3 [Paraphoma chrysanthemicola]
MAPMSPQALGAASDDELDDILNNIAQGRDQAPSYNTEPQSTSATQASRTAGDGLGIDEEIIITKKRIPIPKLDDHRLLSDPGIPRLRKISKERLRFKGKGHEYGDIARMLNMYQLWLDDLYPRAKFADALAIIEKVGHTKRMQMMRKDWIDEGKPRRTTEGDVEDEERAQDKPAEGLHGESMDGVQQAEATVESDVDQDRQAQTVSGASAGSAGIEPDEDELDALLAEADQPSAPAPTTFRGGLPATAAADDDPFADEMDAMAGMEDW